jgi:hypothetical protein
MNRRIDLGRGASIAAAVAALLVTVGCNSEEEDTKTAQQAQIRCLGANECAGMSECAGGPSGNQCAGMNECMGQGWVFTATAEECEEKGGMPQQS